MVAFASSKFLFPPLEVVIDNLSRLPPQDIVICSRVCRSLRLQYEGLHSYKIASISVENRFSPDLTPFDRFDHLRMVDHGLRNDARQTDQIWQKRQACADNYWVTQMSHREGNESVIIHPNVYPPREASPLCKGEWVDRSG